jgi:hypothetical protein
MKKTNEEVEALKENWKKDPCWDIEDTKGFEEHHDELLAWRKEYEFDCQTKEEDRIIRRLRVVELITGVTNADVGQAIHTYAEIEKMLDAESSDLLRAQGRATLLLAAQIQRIADLMESQINSDDLRSIWKVEK